MYNYSIFDVKWEKNSPNISSKESNACRVCDLHDFVYARLLRAPESDVFSLSDGLAVCFDDDDDDVLIFQFSTLCSLNISERKHKIKKKIFVRCKNKKAKQLQLKLHSIVMGNYQYLYFTIEKK